MELVMSTVQKMQALKTLKSCLLCALPVRFLLML